MIGAKYSVKGWVFIFPLEYLALQIVAHSSLFSNVTFCIRKAFCDCFLSEIDMRKELRYLYVFGISTAQYFQLR